MDETTKNPALVAERCPCEVRLPAIGRDREPTWVACTLPKGHTGECVPTRSMRRFATTHT